MNDFRVIDIKESVFADNEKDANELRAKLKEKGSLLVNVMSSPGSGKTTTLTRVIEALRDEMKLAVMEADIDSDVDAKTIAKTGASVIQLHTGGMCHLTAEMSEQGLEAMNAEADLIFLENVGNLVCPAEFDTGSGMNMTILSVPEGHDKPLKYPLMYQTCDLLVVNKIDVMPVFDFDLEKCTEFARRRNPNITVIPISAKTGESVDKLADYFRKALADWRK